VRKLGRPAHDAKSTLELCASILDDASQSKRLLSVSTEIQNAELEYAKNGSAALLYQIPTAKTIGGLVSVKEMSTLYKGTLSRKGSRARRIYDEIKLLPADGLCPLCAQRTVGTLDHYLAKTKHPALTVTPLNLVPSCMDCNKAKGNKQPNSDIEQTLHPYFDDVDTDIWLVARVNVGSPPAVTFRVQPPTSWPNVATTRLKNHFARFGLADLYAVHAGADLSNIKFSLAQLAAREGPTGLARHLLEQATGRRLVAINSWQAAMYEALGTSIWFCEEGYLLI
jgi:hypothetical protein